MRKFFYPLLLIGFLGGIITAGQIETSVDLTDVDAAREKLNSPLAGLVLAFLLKFVTNMLALLAAYPLSKERLSAIENKKYGNIFSRQVDKYQILKGLRDLRWTHHVREEAAHRFKSRPIRDFWIDKAIDTLTGTIVVLIILVIIF